MTGGVNESVTNMVLRATWIICAAFCSTGFYIAASLAQTVAPITPSGLNTQVNLSATPPNGTVQHDITGGTRAGTNLFHSFGEFGVPTHNIANFLNDSGSATSNILGRVTGGNVSNIFGTIQTTGFGNANLFLMNPSGIIFGPNASLNVGGSVILTTVDYLRLTDNVRFNAIPNATTDALLSAAPIAAYGFLGSNPGAITIHGSQLTVSQEHEITLVGGNITIQNGRLENGVTQPAHLSAPNGQINLATATSPGEFLQDLTAASNINGVSFRSFGSVQITPNSTVDVSQTGNGRVSIRGGQLSLEIHNAVLNTADNSAPPAIAQGQDTIVLAPRSSIISQTSSIDTGPDVRITADRITILGVPGTAANSAELPFSGIKSNTKAAGNAGNIILDTTGNIETVNAVNIESVSTSGSPGTTGSAVLTGNAGNIALTSTHGNILLTKGGRATFVFSQANHSNTGNVTASAPNGDIVLEGASLLTSVSGRGGAGRVEIIAKNLLMKAGLLSNESIGPFKPGGITVTLAGNLTMAADFSIQPPVPSNSFIVTSAFSPTGTPAADINITAKNVVATQASLISSETYASGPGGQVNILSDTLQLRDGSRVASGSTFAPPFGSLPQGITPSGAGGTITITGQGSPARSVLIDGAGSGIFSDSKGTGTAGDIVVNARSVMLQNGGKISTETIGTSPEATGGSIIVNATDHVTMTNGASITASSTGPADAGNIKINAGQQLDVRDSANAITTKTEKASGGNIDIKAIDSIRFTNSTISASVGADRGNGGNITIDPNVVVLQNSQILAQAVQGHGGNITITTPMFLSDSLSSIDASTPFGLNGIVRIQSPYAPGSGKIQPMSNRPLQATSLLNQRCAAATGGEFSSFTVAGRNSLPIEPGGWLSSPLALTIPETHGDTVTSKSLHGHEQRGEFPTLSLRQIAPSGFLTKAFAVNRLADCRS